MKIALLGYGQMGQSIADICQEQGHQVVARITSRNRDFSQCKQADVCIDVSSSKAVLDNIRQIHAMKKPLIVGTTGWEEQVDEAKFLVEKNCLPLLFAPNFSIGMHLFQRVLKQACQLFTPFNYSIAALEMHHENKQDKPSGTGKTLEKVLKNSCQTLSIRSGHYPGNHTVFFDAPEDTVEMTHRARNREGFARGALEAALWILTKEKGFFTFDDFMKERVLCNR